MIVKRDTFPAIVKLTSGDQTHQITISRVVITDSSVIIAQDSPNGAMVVYNQPFAETPTWNGTEGTVKIDDTTSLTYKKDSACGCGSRLRSWNPYRNVVSSTQDPTE